MLNLKHSWSGDVTFGKCVVIVTKDMIQHMVKSRGQFYWLQQVLDEARIYELTLICVSVSKSQNFVAALKKIFNLGRACLFLE